jgi:hypothetical protein
MDDVGLVFVSMVKLYNTLLQICITILSFHAKKLYGVIINSFGNSIFSLSSIFGTCKKSLACIFPRNSLALIPYKCG